MFVNSLILPYFDPVAVQFYNVKIHWYALAYVFGILLGYFWVKKLNSIQYSLHTYNARKFFVTLTPKSLDSFITYAVLGIILGGRIGYVVFYNAGYYLENPSQILAVWKGGMSFHGGLIGIIISFYIFAIRNKTSYLYLMDLVALAAPIGLFLGRIANFINSELIGRLAPANLPWGVLYANEDQLRHPSQIYEAICEGLLIFVILNLLAIRTNILLCRGALSSLFLFLYGSFRFFLEGFREPDEQVGLLVYHLTMGQILCIPMILLGIILFYLGVNYGKKGGSNYRWGN